LSGRLTGRYPVAIVQATSLIHPGLVGLPTYRRVAVFARICGTSTEWASASVQRERDTRPECAHLCDSRPIQVGAHAIATRPGSVAGRPAVADSGRPAVADSGRPAVAGQRPPGRCGQRPPGRCCSCACGGARLAPSKRLMPDPAGAPAPPDICTFCSTSSLFGLRSHPSATLGCLTCRYATRRLPAE
jgi:hypothetical protein